MSQPLSLFVRESVPAPPPSEHRAMRARRPHGVGPEAALRALLRREPALAERCLRLLSPPPESVEVTLPEHALPLVWPLLAGRDHEALVSVALDIRARSIEVAVLSSGSPGATVVDPAQIYRWALTRSRPAASILLAHNHPSGDPRPSFADRVATERVAAAGKALHIPLADHLIVADPERWCSMAELGLLSAGGRG